ncbi:YybH family protein [Leucobacter sp. HY1908]
MSTNQPDDAALAGAVNDDELAIQATLMTVLGAFQTGEAAGIGALFTRDADWTNAFGTRLTGGVAVEEYLLGLFADASFSAGKLAGAPEVSVKQLGEDVVVAHVTTTIVGQLTEAGETLGDRTTNSLHILHRQPDGRWLITTQLFADARTETTYRAHK